MLRHLCQRWSEPELSACYQPCRAAKERLLHCLSSIPCQSLSQLTSETSTQLSALVVKQTLCIYVLFLRVKICISAESPHMHTHAHTNSVFINVVRVVVVVT